MDKKTFLEELRKSLRVLKDEEVQDIISEHEQHIDLKVEKGLTVKQAIDDFGNVKILAAEILEGYHVKTEFDFMQENTVPKPNLVSNGQEIAKTSVKTLFAWINMIWRGIFNSFRWCGKVMMSPLIWLKSKMSCKEREHDDVIDPFKHYSHFKNWLVQKMKGFGSMIFRLLGQLVNMSLWCVRICWNCFVTGAALSIGVFGLVCLFAVGIFAVLLFQGYPVIGVTIGCLGLVVCMFAVTVFVWTLIWKTPKGEIKEEISTEPKMMEATEMEEGQHA